MPTSDYFQIPSVMHLIDQVDPKSILEIGVGFGKWGMLCRELLEIGHHQTLSKSKWTTEITGIEIFPDYKNPLWDFAYNKVIIGDALAYLEKADTPHTDLIICCDVIEHFEKPVGLRLLDLMLAKSKVVIVTSPLGFCPQAPVYDNAHEEHKSGWSESDFEAVPHHYREIVYTFVAALSRQPELISKLHMKRPLDYVGFKKGTRELAHVFLERLTLKLGLSRK